MKFLSIILLTLVTGCTNAADYVVNPLNLKFRTGQQIRLKHKPCIGIIEGWETMLNKEMSPVYYVKVTCNKEVNIESVPETDIEN